MGIIESIKKGFSVAFRSMDLVLALFVFGFIWNLINVFAFKNTENPTTQEAVLMIITGIVFILFTIFMQAGSLGYVCDRVKTGSANLSSFASSGGKYYLRILVIGLIVGAVAVVFILLMFLAPYIAVSEERKAIESLKKSVSTVKANFLRILGVFGLLILIGFVFGLVVGLVFALVSLGVKGPAADVIFSALSSFVNSYLGVVVTGAFMNYYLALASNSKPNASGAA